MDKEEASGLAVGAVLCSVDEAHETAAAIAREVLPENVSFVSVDPVLWDGVGPETPPSADLFRKGVLALTPDGAAATDKKAARGLRNMRSRATRCGIELELSSGAGGTRVRLTFSR